MSNGLPPSRRAEQTSVVLNPEQLAEFARLDPSLPAIVIQLRGEELRRNFLYAVLTLLAGVLLVVGTIGGFIYLVMNGHTKAAGLLLGCGVLGLAAGVVRTRL